MVKQKAPSRKVHDGPAEPSSRALRSTLKESIPKAVEEMLADLKVPSGMAWLRDASVILLDEIDIPRWKYLVRALIELEVSYGNSKTKTLGAKGRPKDVGLWIKNYRSASYSPEHIRDVLTFASEYLVWWKNVNPGWRKVSQGAELSYSAEGESWEDLKSPGINGLYSVLICLKWWAKAEQREGQVIPGKAWCDAVYDVQFAISGLKGDMGIKDSVVATEGGLGERSSNDSEMGGVEDANSAQVGEKRQAEERTGEKDDIHPASKRLCV